MKLLLLLAFVASAYSAYFEPGDLHLGCGIQSRPAYINGAAPKSGYTGKSVISSWNFKKDDCCKFSLVGYFSTYNKPDFEDAYRFAQLDWISFNVGVHPKNPCKYKASFRFDPNRIVLRGHGRKPGQVIDFGVGYDGYIDDASCTHIKLIVDGETIKIRSSTCPYAIDMTYGNEPYVGRVLQTLKVYVHDEYVGHLTGLCGGSYETNFYGSNKCFSDLEPGQPVTYVYPEHWLAICSTSRAKLSCENTINNDLSLKCTFRTPGAIVTYDGYDIGLRNRLVGPFTVISQWNKDANDCCKFSVHGAVRAWRSIHPGHPSWSNIISLSSQLDWIEIGIGVHPTDPCKNLATIKIDPNKVLLTRTNMADEEIDMYEGFYVYVDPGKCTHISISRYGVYILVRSNTCPYAMYIRRDDERISDMQIYVDKDKYGGDLDGTCRDGDGSIHNDLLSCFTPEPQFITYGDWIGACSTTRATQYCQSVHA